MAFCHNSISLSATAPVLPVEFQMIFTIDTFTDLPHHISISMVHGIFTIRTKKVGRQKEDLRIEIKSANEVSYHFIFGVFFDSIQTIDM